MSRFRRIYYDIFSGFYDLIIRLHSKDDGASLRDFLVEADVSNLPFRDGTFDVVTCSHAMYELSPDVRRKGLSEVGRALKTNCSFVMMEHEIPKKPFIRFLYYVRLTTMGSFENRQFARDEIPELEKYFTDISKSLSPTRKSKLISGVKSPAL